MDLIVVTIIAGLYFLPALNAALKNHRDGFAIFMINTLIGWTVIGWLAVLVWSFTNPPR